MNLQNKTILVTGGSRGIGLAAAIKLKSRGAVVIINARDQARLTAAGEEHDLVTIHGDVSKESDVKQIYAFIMEKYGRLDVLINNAGYGYFSLLEEIDLEKFNRVFATNVTGAMMMAQEAAKIFKKQNYGNIVNISSTAGTKGFAYGTAYSATKFALKAMSECWRDELRKYNVRVILINPSEVQTKFAVSAGGEARLFNPTKLQAPDIAFAICTALEMEDRGFITELTVFATNPQADGKVEYQNRSVNNVPGKFQLIPEKVRTSSKRGSTELYLGARNGIIPFPEYTSNIVKNDAGLGEHFQGIQRIGQHLIISGGIKTAGEQRSQLLVIRMGTRPENGAWALPAYATDSYDYKKPAPEDKFITVFDIDRAKWHAGGIQALGNLVAVPIYGDGAGAEIRFIDCSNAEAPSEITTIRLVLAHINAKAVALTRLPNEFYMTMVWDDHKLEFYYSNSTSIVDGFSSTRFVKVTKETIGHGFETKDKAGTYQNINFVLDKNGTLYFVATRNSVKASPTIPGHNYADLYKILWPQGYESAPVISLVQQREIFCYDQQCNFGAGAGIYVDEPDHFFLYGASHWLHDGNKRFNFNEYA